MEYNFKVGMKFTKEIIVKEEDTAIAFGSGNISVFSTPRMIGLMESASLNIVDPLLPEEYKTVGIHLDVKHLAATPVGMEVKAIAELVEIDGKKLKFIVKVYDEIEKIGEGYHSRFVIKVDDFIKITEEKLIR